MSTDTITKQELLAAYQQNACKLKEKYEVVRRKRHTEKDSTKKISYETEQNSIGDSIYWTNHFIDELKRLSDY